MSEMEQKPNEITQAEPLQPQNEVAAAAEAGAGSARPPLASSLRQGSRALPVAALLVGLAACGGAVVLWSQLAQQRDMTAQENQALRSRLEQMAGEQKVLAERLGQTGSGLEQARAETQLLNDAVEKMNERLGRDRYGWVLAEADYLLQLANRRLLLERDVTSAVEALLAADQRLSFVKDPLLTPVRAHISDEVAALRAVPVLDVDGIALELGALSKAIDTLVLAGTPTEQAEPAAAADAEDSGWRGVVRAVWADIRSLVVIRHHAAGSLPLTTPDQRLLLRQNLRLKLETARLSLLRGHSQLYTAALQEADGWVEQFYDAKSPATVSMREALGRLAAVNIAPPLPDIDDSLHTLRAVSARLERGARP